MLDSTFEINVLEDMAQVENRVTELSHGEMRRCSILNTTEYYKFRLAAIYKVNKENSTISRDRLKLVLRGNKVYIYYGIENVGVTYDNIVSKRKEMDTDIE
jgi:hypothetical protein